MKTKQYFLVLMIIALFLRCNKQEGKEPKNLIPKDKMIEIISDLYLIEAIRSHNAAVLDSFAGTPNAYIYKKYKIDSLQFVKSNIYYAQDTKEYKEMHDQIRNRFVSEKKELEAKIAIENKKKELLAQKKAKAKNGKEVISD